MKNDLNRAMLKYGFNESIYDLSIYEAYTDAVLEKNKVMNLTAIKDPDEFMYKHIIDSLSILKYHTIKKEHRVLDIGTGAGFPGVPIKLYTDCHMTLLDALNKRIKFINETTQSLEIKDCIAIHGRAEEYALNQIHREVYDFVLTRAVAHLRILSELSLPFLKVGGLFIALKGPQYVDELAQSESTLHALGGKIKDIHSFQIDEYGLEHFIISIEKVKVTSKIYPRQFNLIQTKSL